MVLKYIQYDENITLALAHHFSVYCCTDKTSRKAPHYSNLNPNWALRWVTSCFRVWHYCFNSVFVTKTLIHPCEWDGQFHVLESHTIASICDLKSTPALRWVILETDTMAFPNPDPALWMWWVIFCLRVWHYCFYLTSIFCPLLAFGTPLSRKH